MDKPIADPGGIARDLRGTTGRGKQIAAWRSLTAGLGNWATRLGRQADGLYQTEKKKGHFHTVIYLIIRRNLLPVDRRFRMM
jgi:hypothetical protein